MTGPCEWPLGCDGIAKRGIEGLNVFGDKVRHFYCEPHLLDIISGRAYRRTLAQMRALGLSGDVLRPDIRATNARLSAHQDVCLDCGAVRRWTLEQMRAGRVLTKEDRDYVGRYTVEHACAIGLPLYTAVGAAMMTDPAE